MIKDARDFFLWDYGNTLFPLDMNRLIVDRYVAGLRAFIQDNVLSDTGAFLPQQRVFASKRGWLLRRTVKLDPVAEFFLYDLIFRNRRCFREPQSSDRRVFGFRFSNGLPLSAVRSYGSFRRAVAKAKSEFSSATYYDIASYFNHVYHHDLVAWFEEAGAPPEDVQWFGKYLREICGGRSVDCLPHGLYPAKMVGSSYLGFLDASNRIRAKRMVRLMDDIWLFDDDESNLIADALRIQALLGDRGLTINDRKSLGVGESLQSEVAADIDEIKIQLLRKRREALVAWCDYGDEDADDVDEDPEELDELTDEEHEYLLNLLRGDGIQEEDAELVLTLMKDHSDDVLEHVPALVREFPGLSRRLYSFCEDLDDHDTLVGTLLEHVRGGEIVTEYQLFWFAKMAQDYLMEASGVGSLLSELYEHEQATDVTRAKILENPSQSHGLPELRAEHLRSGHSGWLAWASAVGARNMPKGTRNQILKYFRK